MSIKSSNNALTLTWAVVILFTIFPTKKTYPQDFHPDNLVVYRYGDGKPRNKTVPVFVDEYTVEGKLVRTIDIPYVSSQSDNMLTGLPYTSSAIPIEGLMTLSQDGRYITIIGYQQRVGQSTGYSNKTIGRIGVDGKANTSTILLEDRGSPRCAVAENDGFYIAATGTKGEEETAGLRFIPFGETVQTKGLVAVNSQLLSVYTFLNRMYITRGGNSYFSIGTSLPVTSKDRIKEHKLSGSSAVHQIVMLDTDQNNIPDLLYALDNVGDGFLRKYTSKDGQKWEEQGSLDFSGTTSNIRSVTAKMISSKDVAVYITSVGSFDSTVKSHIVKVADKVNEQLSKETSKKILATASPYTMFRSITLAPIKK